jgi:cytochrome c oxidase subunit II
VSSRCAVRGWRGCAAAALALLPACEGAQSALAPAGRAAERIADLFWGLTIGGAIIWLAIVALTIYAMNGTRRVFGEREGRLLIVTGGVVLPVIVLAGALVYALALLPELLEPAAEGAPRVRITGEQYWWRVRYLREGGEVELANELRVARGTPVELELESRDVVHSFWVPSLAGKVDMIPGRRTRLRLDPTRAGTFRGVCAEYCGTSHAFMAMRVVVSEPHELARWLERQAAPASSPRGQLAVRGAAAFLENGCGACHSVRGTAADGVIGPDLTHVGSRLTLAAGRLSNDTTALERWIADAPRIKPGVTMPHFAMLPRSELSALAAYLKGLD